MPSKVGVIPGADVANEQAVASIQINNIGKTRTNLLSTIRRIFCSLPNSTGDN